jgi:phytoene dehydrogenase-like protein
MARAERGMLPATSTIFVGQPHRLDPSRCPEGKGDAAGEIVTDGTWSGAARGAYADRIEAILKRHIKDFDAIKPARSARSPADLEAMNFNLVGGDPCGGRCSLDQFFLFRRYPHSANGSGIVRGLIHIGASAHPGPGLGGGSGFLAAKRLGA